MALWSRRRRFLRVLLFSFFVTWTTYSLLASRFGERQYDTWKGDPFPQFKESGSRNASCKLFDSPIAESVQVILKTGAAEANNKLVTHLSTVTSCVPPSELLIFSDFEEHIKAYHVHDALSDLSRTYRAQSADFKVYETQKEYRRANLTSMSLTDGWKLDKYKFLPMIQSTWKMRSDKKWYLFLEVDTFVVWDNLFYWLSHLDPDKPLYLGSPVWPKGKPVFAHGGTGFVLSHAAMDKFHEFTSDLGYSSPQLNIDMRKECCGDEVLAHMLKHKGVTLRGYWPLFNGEKPTTVRFGKEHWCEPIITMHHMGTEDTSKFWQWLQNRTVTENKPFLFQDLFTFIQPHITPKKENWDNMSEDVSFPITGHALKLNPLEQLAIESAKDCQHLCDADTLCFQFRFSPGTCKLGYSIRLGHATGSSEPKTVSGWNMDRIHKWIDENSPCAEPHWVRANP